MLAAIDREETGKTIRRYMKLRGFCVQDVAQRLSLGCVQSVYHWLDGKSLPSLDNLYALSQILGVPMDSLIAAENPDSRIRRNRLARLRFYREALV